MTKTLNENNEADKLKIKIVEDNDLAITELIICMDCSTESANVAFQVVNSTETMEYLNGNAAEALLKPNQEIAAKDGPNPFKVEEI
jgi:hypothetical protein